MAALFRRRAKVRSRVKLGSGQTAPSSPLHLHKQTLTGALRKSALCQYRTFVFERSGGSLTAHSYEKSAAGPSFSRSLW